MAVATAAPKRVVDDLTGEEFDPDQLDYLNQLRDSMAQGHLTGQPTDNGDWNIGMPEELNPPPPPAPMAPPTQNPPGDEPLGGNAPVEPDLPPPPAPAPPPPEEEPTQEEGAPQEAQPSQEPLAPQPETSTFDQGGTAPAVALPEDRTAADLVSQTRQGQRDLTQSVIQNTPRSVPLTQEQVDSTTETMSGLVGNLRPDQRDRVLAAYTNGAKGGSVTNGFYEATVSAAAIQMAQAMKAGEFGPTYTSSDLGELEGQANAWIKLGKLPVDMRNQNTWGDVLLQTLATAPIFGGAGSVLGTAKVVGGVAIGIPAGQAAEYGMNEIGAPDWATTIAKTTAQFAPMTFSGGSFRRGAIEALGGGVGELANEKVGGPELPVLGSPGAIFGSILSGWYEKRWTAARDYMKSQKLEESALISGIKNQEVGRQGSLPGILSPVEAEGFRMVHEGVKNAAPDDMVTVYGTATEAEALRYHASSPQGWRGIEKEGELRTSEPKGHTLGGTYVYTDMETARTGAEANIAGRTTRPVRVPEGPIASTSLIDRMRRGFGWEDNAEGNAALTAELKAQGFVGAQQRPGTEVYFGGVKPLHADPELALTEGLGRGVVDPHILAWTVPRSLLNLKDNVFSLKRQVAPTLNEIRDGWVPNAKDTVSKWLAETERGSLRFGPDEQPLDPRAAEILGIKPESEMPGGSHYMSEEALRRYSDLKSADEAMSNKADVLAGMDDVEVRERYRGSLLANDQLESNVRDNGYGFSQEELDNPRLMAEMQSGTERSRARGMQDVVRFGEELFRRTDGKEGMAPRIVRAAKQVLVGIEGAIKGDGEMGGGNLQRFLPHFSDGPEYRVHYDATHAPGNMVAPEATQQILQLQNIDPHLTPTEKALNVLKGVTHWGVKSDPLASRMIAEDARVRHGIIPAEAQRAGQQALWIQHAFFKTDKEGRLTDFHFNKATIQDVAANFPQWMGLLSDQQVSAMGRLKRLFEGYEEAYKEQGLDLPGGKDIQPGGFYLPRGNLEEAKQWGVKPPKSRSSKISQQQQRQWPSMGEAIEQGEHYVSFDVAVEGALRDMGRQLLDAHMANVLKNSTDEAGVPLASTPESRLLQNNSQLKAKVDGLRVRVESLRNSITNMDDNIHGVWFDFVHSPAPNLDALRDALNSLTVSDGKMWQRATRPGEQLARVQGEIQGRQATKPGPTQMPTSLGRRQVEATADVASAKADEVTHQAAFKQLRKGINEDVFVNRGKFRNFTGEEKRRIQLRDELNDVNIKRGRYRGMDIDQAKAQLDYLKDQVNQVMPDWQEAKRKAQQVGAGEMEITGDRGAGKLLRGHGFDEGLASVWNGYLEQTGKLQGKGARLLSIPDNINSILRMLRATGDISALGIQGLVGAWHEPQSYRRAAAGMFRTMFDPIQGKYVLGKYIDDFDQQAFLSGAPQSRDWVRAGLHIGGADTEFTEGGLFGKLPFIKQANRGFGYFGDILRLDGAQSQYQIKGLDEMSLPERQKAMGELSNFHNMMTGYSPGRTLGDVGNTLLFAPRFLQSQLEMVTNAMTPGGLSHDQARRSLTKMIGGGVLMTMMLNEAAGNDDFDYMSPIDKYGRLNSNFMRVRMFGKDTSLFGPWDSLLRAVGTTISEGDPTYVARTKASPLVSTAWDVLSGKTFTGADVPGPRDLAHNPGLVANYALRALLPFSMAEPVANAASGQQSVGGALGDVAIGTTGLKSSPLSNTEQRDQLRQKATSQLLSDPANLAKYIENPRAAQAMADTLKNTGWDDLGATEQKLVNKYIEEKFPEDNKAYHDKRMTSGSIFEETSRKADVVRAKYQPGFDKLFQDLLNGEDQKKVWDQYNTQKDMMAGEMAGVYEDKHYADAVKQLRPNDMRKIEDDWNAIIDKASGIPGNRKSIDWDAVAEKQLAFLDELQVAHPEMAGRFAATLHARDSLNVEEANPITQLRKKANVELQDYYTLLDGAKDTTDAEAKAAPQAWLQANPTGDVYHWLTSTTASPTLHSLDAAETALSLSDKRPVHLANSSTRIDSDNLQFLQQYDKEIAQMNSLPATMVKANGSKINPREELRKHDPLYDALYFYLGYSSKDDKGTAPVYHLEAVNSYLRQWGQRTDGAKPRRAQ